MYIPEDYQNKNLEDVKDFLYKNSFGILLSQEGGRVSGTHIPMELAENEKGEDVLIGHIAKANPQSKNIKNKDDVLAIFTGPHSYISSSWYQKEDVPTWNYVAVHIYGKVKVIEGEELFESLKKLVDKYEQHSENPVSVEEMSKSTLDQINGIVGFSIRIEEIQAAYKLSQKRGNPDVHNIINELEKDGDCNSIGVAEEMKKQKK